MSDVSDPRKHELTIELRDVVREYKVGGQSVRALDGISLRLSGGQFVSVVGPSGAVLIADVTTVVITGTNADMIRSARGRDRTRLCAGRADRHGHRRSKATSGRPVDVTTRTVDRS